MEVQEEETEGAVSSTATTHYPFESMKQRFVCYDLMYILRYGIVNANQEQEISLSRSSMGSTTGETLSNGAVCDSDGVGVEVLRQR
jgi:hypothetical protein